MRKLLLASSIAMLLAGPVRAGLMEDQCADIAGTVERIEQLHQHGIVPISMLLKKMPALKPIIIKIWSGPRYQTERMQEQAVLERTDQVNVDCLNAGAGAYFESITE